MNSRTSEEENKTLTDKKENKTLTEKNDMSFNIKSNNWEKIVQHNGSQISKKSFSSFILMLIKSFEVCSDSKQSYRSEI